MHFVFIDRPDYEVKVYKSLLLVSSQQVFGIREKVKTTNLWVLIALATAIVATVLATKFVVTLYI